MSAMFKYFKSLFVSERKTQIKQTSPEEELTNKLKPYERHLYRIQDIIIWKDTSLSIASVVLVNFVFWFISYFEWRFFGFFFTLMSAVLFHDTWVNYIWPEIKVKDKDDEPKKTDAPIPDLHHEGLLSLPELSRYATELQSVAVKKYKRLRLMRVTQPTLFCVISSAGCLLLAGLGSVLSGMALLYVISVAVLTLPGVYIHLVTPEQKEVILRVLHSLYSIILPPESSDDVDEYMPDTSQENLDVLNKAGNNSQDLSTPSSESSMVDLMIPCVMDESSMDSFTLSQGGGGGDSDSEGDLSFKNSHFNGSSSGEDFTKDLTDFPEVKSGFPTSLTGVFYKTFPAISGRLQFPATGEGIPPPTEEDSDSEFEIIDENS